MLHSRKKRLESLIQQEVAQIIDQLKDPRISMVTVTNVSMNNDLSVAHIYITVLDERHREETMKALEKAHGFIKKELGNRLIIKYMPDIKFEYDETIRRAARIEELLTQLHRETKEEDKTP